VKYFLLAFFFKEYNSFTIKCWKMDIHPIYSMHKLGAVKHTTVAPHPMKVAVGLGISPAVQVL
jgi:hypothetical protein